MLKRFTAVLAAALVLFVGAFVVGAQSPASASFSQCPANHACMFDGVNFSANILDLPFSTNYPGCHNLSGFNDRASSLIVQYGGGAYMRFWMDANCSGLSKALGPNQSVADLRSEPCTFCSWNDSISSYAVYLPSATKTTPTQ